MDIVLNDRYQILKEISKKAFSKTFFALDSLTGNQVIIKLLTLDSSDFEWSYLKLFEREAQTLRSLEHSAIPEYIDYFEVKEHGYKGFALVQTFIDADSLQSLIEGGRRFSEEELRKIAEELLKILNYLHNLTPPLIHRDIKPSNILLKESSFDRLEKLYLVDFGSAGNIAAAERGTITIVGTYGYMPPEQFGSRTVPASDLYSLGATLIYLATGKHPADLPQKNGRIEFENLARLNKAFTNWLTKLVEPNLSERFHSAADALFSLANLAEGSCYPETASHTYRSPSEFSTQEQPAGCRIKVKRTGNKLQLIIPEKKTDERKSPGDIIWLSFLFIAVLNYTTLAVYIFTAFVVQFISHVLPSRGASLGEFIFFVVLMCIPLSMYLFLLSN